MIGTIFGIIGTIMTIGFGIYTIRISRKSKDKVHLTFEKTECYSLFNEAVERLNIEIQYDKKPISEKLILLKAKFINTGTLDIDKSTIYDPIKITSKSDYKWLEVNIIDKPRNATSSIKKENDKELTLNWDLLKKEEFIEFEALIESLKDNNGDETTRDFYNSLDFEFRISNLDKIHKEEEVSETFRKTKSKIKQTNVLAITYLALGITFAIFGNFIDNIAPDNRTINSKVVYQLINENNDTLQSNINIVKENLIEIKYAEENKLYSIETFNKNIRVNNLYEIKENRLANLTYRYGGLGIILMSGFLFYTAYRRKRKLIRMTTTVANTRS